MPGKVFVAFFLKQLLLDWKRKVRQAIFDYSGAIY